MKLIPLLLLLALAALTSSCTTTEKRLALEIVDASVGVLVENNQPTEPTLTTK